MFHFRAVVILSLLLFGQTETMEVDVADNTLSSDPSLILRLVCQRVASFSYDDVMSMLLVHKNMATILTQTANIRIELLKREIQKWSSECKYDFNAVTFNPLGCSAAWLEGYTGANGTCVYIRSIWADVDMPFCTITEVLHGYCVFFDVKWRNNNSGIQITESELSYVFVANPKFKNGTFVVCACNVLDENCCTTKMVINQNFIKKYKKYKCPARGTRFFVGRIQ